MTCWGWRISVNVPLMLTPSLSVAQSLHVPSLAESLSRTTIRAPAISPDAASVAYLKRQTDWKENEFVWQLWLVDAASGRNFQLTRGHQSASAAQWSPDGRWLAFITERLSSAIEPWSASKDVKVDGADADKLAGKQIWLIAPTGGEAWPLTRSTTDVMTFHWSRDGKQVFFTAKASPSKAARAHQEKYSAYDVVEKDYDMAQLWSVDFVTAEKMAAPVTARPLTSDRKLNVNSFAVSPDSTRVAFSATHNPQPAFIEDEDIYLLDLADGKVGAVTKIVALPGPDRSPMFSADGKQLAFTTSLGQPNFFYANSHLAIVDLGAVMTHRATVATDVRDLTKNFDEDPQAVDWRSNGVYFVATQRMTNQLFRVDPITLGVQRVTNDALLLDDASLTPDGKTVAFIADSPSTLSELYISGTQGFDPKKLTDFTAQVGGWQVGTVEVVSWRSRDGTLIEGVLHKPANYDPKRKYPLLVKIHGGPTGVSQPRFLPSDYAYPVQAFLAKGALVLEPNYRGSAGYGSKFRALNVRNLGIGDMWDVMSGVDSLIAKGIVDPNRLAAMGWSQGGYVSAFLTTHTHRFKAISVGAGISDWTAYYVSTDITPFTPQYLQATPWDDPQIYAITSPITTIKQASTPTLIQHGSADRRVPVSDAFELYRGLLDQRVDVRLIIYTGFGHGIDKPKSSLALLQANLDWFGHYLWDEPIPKDSPLYGGSELGSETE